MIRLIVHKAWRYRHPSRGAQVLPAGEYGVPDQVSERLAERAVADGLARMYRVKLPEAAIRATADAGQPSAPPAEAGRKRGRKRKSKGPAPENLALGPAPENKSPLH